MILGDGGGYVWFCSSDPDVKSGWASVGRRLYRASLLFAGQRGVASEKLERNPDVQLNPH